MDETFGHIALSWLGPLHFGTFGGVGAKVSWVIPGLMPPILFVTGSPGKKWMALRQTGRPKTEVYN